VSAVNAALWGDFDNDGLVDVYLCRRGPNQLWRQSATGTWEDITAATGTAGADLDTVDGAFFDADHDGDLDLYLVNADGPDELFNNNLDGSFRPLAAEYQLDGGDGASALVVPADLDGDRDADLIVINQSPPHRVYINDRLWSYHEAPGYELFTGRTALAALAADVDADGLTELYTVSPDGELLRWRADDDGTVKPVVLGIPEVLAGATGAQLASHDVNGDGRVDLIVSSARGWAVLAPAADSFTTLYSANATPDAPHDAHLPFIGDSLTGPGMLAYSAADHGLSLWRPGTGRYPFITLALRGSQDDAQSMRSNASGLGAEVAVRVDSRWTRLHSYRNHSGPGQSLQPLATGLKGASRADFIAINWSDGILQSEVDVTTGRLETVTETQRQLSSCPVLFAWNGEEYVFVSDLLGVAALGYAIGHGEYAPPRPWENFLLPEGLLRARDGRLELKITEPMEENGYIDAVRLIGYDLPPGWQMVLDERMGIAGPEPTGKPLFYRRELLPDSAVNDRGSQVIESIRDSDGKAAPVGGLDTRFIGRLRNEHVLTLTFPEALDTSPGQPVLVIDGWIEYPYSQTAFAASQAGAAFKAPTLEAVSADGRWQPVAEEFGYPAGMPRRMALPLPALPKGTRSLRLRTNQQVYWDRIAVAFAEPAPEHSRQQLTLHNATLKKTGFARRTTFGQFLPHYDYAKRSPFLDTRYMAGNYSRFGNVNELVGTVDDAVAIFGPGEEIHLEFDTAGPAPDGWRRVFVLETNGWAKDMDMFTLDGETVGPLPTTGKPAAAREALHARYNTRYRAGY
ncbi:MAG: VCBS repeat-containing protein, partial [Gammaproteobacteria bacterium]|nr:VCBS repeat-containing protein [Gammaproteobacteria bacterium]